MNQSAMYTEVRTLSLALTGGDMAGSPAALLASPAGRLGQSVATVRGAVAVVVPVVVVVTAAAAATGIAGGPMSEDARAADPAPGATAAARTSG